MTTFEQLIVHAVRNEPALCRSDILNVSLFGSPDCGRLFAAISDIFEDTGTGEPIDPVILSKKSGVSLERIAEIEAGCYLPRANGFYDWIRAQEQERAKVKLLSVLSREVDAYTKTGCFESAKVAELEELFGILKANGNGRHVPISCALSEIEPKEVPWLWPDFIPLGRASFIGGDPGAQKTFFCLDLAARLSRGLPWADGSRGIGPAKSFYLSVEDDIADTIRPRVDSLGGDPSMIAAYSVADKVPHLNLNTPAGLRRLEEEVVRIGNVRLVVIDPIIDFSGDIRPNATEEVRSLLTPLIQVAARQNFALILLGHLNKAQALSAIYRVSGTTGGWLGKCRAAFMVFRDPDDKILRHVIPLKANLARRDPAQLEFRIIDGQIDIRVSFDEVDADEMLNPQRGPSPREREEAAKWLDDYFAKQPEAPAVDVEAAARARGISLSTLRRAKKARGYLSRKRSESGGRSVWVWTKS